MSKRSDDQKGVRYTMLHVPYNIKHFGDMKTYRKEILYSLIFITSIVHLISPKKDLILHNME